jgi:hypothetical protein
MRLPIGLMGLLIGLAPFDEKGVERDAAGVKVPRFVAVRPGVLPRKPGGTVLGLVLRAETDWTPVQR